MATVYSLLCWGGKDGLSVTAYDTANDRWTISNHGIRAGYPMPVRFLSGTLPTVSGTALDTSTTYYAKYYSSTQFELYRDSGLTTLVNITGSGTSVKLVSAYYATLASTTRWTLAGTVHIYSSGSSMVTGFASIMDAADDAVCEVVGVWDDIHASGCSISHTASTFRFESMVNGVRSDAYHDHLFGTGYRLYSTSTSQGVITLQSYDITIDGIETTYGGASNNGSYLVAQGTLSAATTVKNCLGSCASTGAIHGVQIGYGTVAYNNIVAGIPGTTTYAAFRDTTGQLSRVYNNIAVGNPIGFECSTGGGHGFFYNNIAVGNTVNWGPRPLFSAAKASHNACQDTDTISFTSSGSGSTLTFASPHLYQGNTQIFMYSTGALPTVGGVPLVQGQKYWVRSRATSTTMTIGLTDGGTALTFDGAGTGTHYIYTVWGSEEDHVAIDYSTPADVFEDPTTTLDFSPASVTAPQVETGTFFDWMNAYDLRDALRPSYSGSAYGTAVTAGSFIAGLSYTIASVGTTDFTLIGAASNTVGVQFKATGVGTGTGTATLGAVRDIGAIEFDLGYGDWPATQTYTVSGVTLGRIKIAKQSDGTEIYNDTTLPSAEPSTFATNTPVYIYIRKGSSAPYYHPLKLSATIDVEGGLDYDATGLQQEDIAAHDYTGTAVATDWSFNLATGAITHDSGTTRYSVRDLYSWHQDYTDGSTQIDDDPLMHGTTPTIFELINSADISDSDLQDLYGGSIEFEDGTLWANIWTTDTMAAAHDVYLVQDGVKVTDFWASGPIDVLVKVNDAGTLIDSGLVDVYARPYGYSYAYYQVDASGGGRNVAPISTLVDVPTTTISSATAATYSDVTFTFGSTSQDLGEGGGAATYYCRIDCAGRTLDQVFARCQYVTRDVSTATLNSLEGWRYRKAHSSYTANDQYPFGRYAAGFWSVARGVWLDNVASADQYNYQLTDHAGTTHQLTVPLNQSVSLSGLDATWRVQIYDTDAAEELYNDVPGATTLLWEDPLSPAADRLIRLRVMSTTNGDGSAIEMIDTTIGTCGTTESTIALSYLVAASEDTVDTANGIDGSTITGITINDGAMILEIDSGTVTAIGGVDVVQVDLKDLYAYETYWLGTEEGIRDEARFISAIDPANYEFVDFKLRNDTGYPVVIVGGYARDAATNSSASLTDYAGGAIHYAPDHVVNNVVTVGGANIITGDVADVLAAIPSAAANATAVWAKTLP